MRGFEEPMEVEQVPKPVGVPPGGLGVWWGSWCPSLCSGRSARPTLPRPEPGVHARALGPEAASWEALGPSGAAQRAVWWASEEGRGWGPVSAFSTPSSPAPEGASPCPCGLSGGRPAVLRSAPSSLSPSWHGLPAASTGGHAVAVRGPGKQL